MTTSAVHLHWPGDRATLCGQRDRRGPALPYRSAALPLPPRLDVCPACLLEQGLTVAEQQRTEHDATP